MYYPATGGLVFIMTKNFQYGCRHSLWPPWHAQQNSSGPSKTDLFHSTNLPLHAVWDLFPNNSLKVIMRVMTSRLWMFTVSLPSFWDLLLPLSEGFPASLAFNGEPGPESCGAASASPTARWQLLMGDFFLLVHLRAKGIHPALWHPQCPVRDPLLNYMAGTGWYFPCVISLWWGAVSKASLCCPALWAPVVAPLLLVLWLETFLWIIPHRARLCSGNLLKLLHMHAKN